MSDINPEKVWRLTQQEIAEISDLSQSYVHYILKCDRKPSTESAEKLEIATGVCREAWLWPERHYNPYIPFCNGKSCLVCVNRKDKTKWMVERMIHVTEKSDSGRRLKTFFRVVEEVLKGLGFLSSLKFDVISLTQEGFLYLFTTGKSNFTAPYLVPYWLVPWISEEITNRNLIEIRDMSDKRLINSLMDARWIAETNRKSLLAVSSLRLLLITSVCAGGPSYEWTDESVKAMNWMVNELDNLLGDELDHPLLYI